MPTPQAVLDRIAPDSRVIVRDQDWQVIEAERHFMGASAVVRCAGRSELVRDRRASFSSDLDTIEPEDLAATTFHLDTSASRRLETNYRTSQQILGWAVEIHDGAGDRQPGRCTRAPGRVSVGLHRFFPDHPAAHHPGRGSGVHRGPDPEVAGEGSRPPTMGITARTKGALRAVTDALDRVGTAWADAATTDAAAAEKVGTMHPFKGLQVARLVVAAANTDQLPPPVATTSEAENSTQHALDVLRERCLLYVACTWTRDHPVVMSSGTPSHLLPGQ